METVGYYAGTFYPFTKGHERVVHEALKIFDKVIIGIHCNENKAAFQWFDTNAYIEAIQNCFSKEKVIVLYVPYEPVGLKAKKFSANYLIRGIRNSTDYEYEENLAKINEELFDLSTIYFRAGKYGFVSSSMVKELRRYGLSYKEYVPTSIYKYLEEEE